jgi:hypothetical protein
VSTTTIRAGQLLTLDPSDKRVIQFDWDAEALPASVTIASYVITITTIKQNGVTILTTDQDSLVSGSRKVQLRLLATTATNGDRYSVACKIATDETPTQEIERQIFILVQNQ